MTGRWDMCGDVQVSLLWKLESNLKTRFSNKEGKIKTGSTRNCVVNVAVIAAVTAFMLSVLVFLAVIQMLLKEEDLEHFLEHAVSSYHRANPEE
ncbi:hypothetical protein Tco_1049743 [Tanacetum coccineum]